ncbi:MAG: noncanonical pyrimidine nucleotidase, YjjG family, partial [Candidatus Moranbacteria bacterium]|nr:noncanonical pyrimidine nucleotidase, YjjG family [Candidatus Moranbacteria bacterium]
MNGKVKLVLFDLDNTILDFSKIEEYSLKKTFLKYGISIDEEDVRKYREINKEEWGKYENGLQSKEETPLNRFMAFSDYLGKEFPAEDVNRRYLESLTDEVYFVENAESTLIGIDRLGVE